MPLFARALASTLIAAISSASVQAQPKLETVLRGIEDIDQALRGYQVRLEINSRQFAFPPQPQQPFVDQTATVKYSSDAASRVRFDATLNTVNAGKPLTIKYRGVYNGEVVKTAEGTERLDAGRIVKNVGAVFFHGINPRNYISHVESVTAAKYFKAYEAVKVSDEVYRGKAAVVVHSKLFTNDGQESVARVYLDPKRSYSLIKASSYYRNPPSTDWVEYNRTEVLDAVQDPSGLWLPTRVVHEEFGVASTPGPPPQLVKSDITLHDWAINPNLPDSQFSLDFDSGTIVQDEVTGQTYKTAKVDDQMLLDQAHAAAEYQARGGSRRAVPLFIGLGGALTAIIVVVISITRNRRSRV